MKTFILALIAFTAINGFANKNQSNNLSFVVLSDIHIYTSGKIPAKAKVVIEHVLNLKPDLIFITGDHTNGNRNDGHQLPKVSTWYNSLEILLAPLTQAGIPLFPTVGNHDYYEPAHKKAYDRWAKNVISKSINLLSLGQPNDYLSFMFNYKNVDFFIFNLWRQNFGEKQKKWVKEFAQNNNKKNLRFGFGHVPLRSTIGRTSTHFYKTTSTLFEELGLDIYFCGHEHLHWDETNPLTNSFRQTIVGTASGTYNFPIRRQMAEVHCTNSECIMPATRKYFQVKKLSNGAAEQKFKQNWIHVKVSNGKISTDSYALGSNDEQVNFHIDSN